MDRRELQMRYYRLHHACVDLLKAAPAHDQLHPDLADAVAELTRAMLPPDPNDRATQRDPSRHFLTRACSPHPGARPPLYSARNPSITALRTRG